MCHDCDDDAEHAIDRMHRIVARHSNLHENTRVACDETLAQHAILHITKEAQED